MSQNNEKCEAKTQESACVLCGVDQDLSTNKDADVLSVHSVINNLYTQCS
jgi:hypothetical protein